MTDYDDLFSQHEQDPLIRELNGNVLWRYEPMDPHDKRPPVTSTAPFRAAEKLKAMQWQPIETAPKDGTPILSRLGPFVYIVFWSDDKKLKSPIPWWEMGSAEWENNKWIGYHEEYYAASPTHWMALPEGPK